MDVGHILRSTRHSTASVARARPALSLAGDHTMTYGELDDLANRYANTLLRLGVRRGDRVAILSHNSLDYLPLYFAIASIGGVVVRVNFRLSPSELRYVLTDSGATALVTTQAFVEVVDAVRDNIPVRSFIVLDGPPPEWAVPRVVVDEVETSPPDVPIPHGDDPAMLMYTSGTTGHSKGVVWTHDATMWHAALQALHYGFDGDTVAMTTGPLYHVGAFENFLSACLFVHGHGVVIPSLNLQLETVLAAMDRHEVTDAFVFSFMLNELLGSDEHTIPDLSGLRRIVAGGSGVRDDAAELLARKYPRAALQLAYGMTETGTSMTTGALSAADRSDAIGRPLPGYEIRVVDSRGADAAVGSEGEILARGPVVAEGYWNRPDDSTVAFSDGWCRSGDLGSVDADGVLHLSGRVKEIVRTGGENVHPGEVESVLITHAGVEDVAVIGVPDERLEEALCAVIVRSPGSMVESEELITFVRGHIAGYKKPRHVVFADSLPRNASGKLLRQVLRDEVLATLADESLVSGTP